MISKEKQSRRDFLKASAVLSSFFIVPRHVLGGSGFIAPSDKVNFGYIGLGKQVGGLRNNFLKTGEVQIVAASDVYAAKLKAFTDATHKWYETELGVGKYKSVAPYEDFRELLARKDIDAVVIASPDHWHAAMAVRAAEAGKDIYCEKPLALTVKEGRAMVNATHKHKRVFQTGSMQRSWPEFQQAVQLVRTGAIGDVKKVVVSVAGPPKPWDLEAQTLPEGLNWNLWMGPNTIDRPYNNALAPTLTDTFWAKWRDYDEFGGGYMTDWGAHMFDIAQWGLGMDGSGPTEIIYSEPGKGLVYKYANGAEVVHNPTGKNFCQFIGSEGEVFVGRGELKTTPESLKDKKFKPEDYKFQTSDNHYKDFLNSIKTRKKPICDVEVGQSTSAMCNIGNISYRLQRSLKWDPKKEVFLNDKEANALTGRALKKEWKV